MLNIIAGNLISGAILGSFVPIWVLYMVFGIIGAVGTAGMLLLKYVQVCVCVCVCVCVVRVCV